MSTGTSRTRIGVVGVGAMGFHHARNLAAIPEAELVGVYDSDPQAAAKVQESFGARPFDSFEALASEVEAMVLAAPTAVHASLGCRLLEAGTHVLVEKPVAASLAEADQLLAAAGDRVLAVGHVEFFNPALQALLVRKVVPGYLVAERLGPFTRRSLDIDVILDLMIHDLQILHALDPSPLREVRATGINVLSPRIDIANVRLALESGCVANITASRVSAEKTRTLRLFGQDRYYSVDYPTQEIKGYRLERKEGGAEPDIRPEEFSVESREPLRAELEAFLAACRGEEASYVDGAAGRRALATALSVVEAIC